MTADKEFHVDLEAMRSDIAALTENVGKLAKEASKAKAAMTKSVTKAAKASARIGSKMWDEATDLGHDTAQAATDAAHSGRLDLERRIRQKPMSSVLFALGIGFVVGVIGLNMRR